jgi:hypothetical protein
MTSVGQEANYLAYLQGTKAQDIPAVRKLYADVITAYKAAADGSKLGMFFGNASGFPLITVLAPADQAAPSMTGATFAGFVEIFEPEHEAVFLSFGL